MSSLEASRLLKVLIVRKVRALSVSFCLISFFVLGYCKVLDTYDTTVDGGGTFCGSPLLHRTAVVTHVGSQILINHRRTKTSTSNLSVQPSFV
jgi:hypothetical protein